MEFSISKKRRETLLPNVLVVSQLYLQNHDMRSWPVHGIYTVIKHNVTTIVHGFYEVHILGTMHWNLLAENSRGWQEY
jgi:hypothetical protein